MIDYNEMTGFQMIGYAILTVLTSPALYIGIAVWWFFKNCFSFLFLIQVQLFAKIAAQAAEQIGFLDEPNVTSSSLKKYEFVFNAVRNKYPTIDMKTLQVVAESAIYEVSNAQRLD